MIRSRSKGSVHWSGAGRLAKWSELTNGWAGEKVCERVVKRINCPPAGGKGRICPLPQLQPLSAPATLGYRLLSPLIICVLINVNLRTG